MFLSNRFSDAASQYVVTFSVDPVSARAQATGYITEWNPAIPTGAEITALGNYGHAISVA
jgi:hypothetical protein